MSSFHSLSTVAFASGINIPWSERYFAHALGFPRLAEHNNIWSFVFLSSQVHTREYLVLPGLFGLLEEFVPQRAFLRSIHRIEFVHENSKIVRILVWPTATLSDGIGSESHICNLLSFPRGSRKNIGARMNPCTSECYFSSFSRLKLFGEQTVVQYGILSFPCNALFMNPFRH